MKCKLCGVNDVVYYPNMNIPQLLICKDCLKDCDCSGLEKL